MDEVKTEEQKLAEGAGLTSRFYVVRTTVGQERNAANMLSAKAKRENAHIYSILSAPELRGYIIVEAPEKREFEKTLKNMAHIKGVVEGEMSFAEIEKFLEPTSPAARVNAGDLVEFVNGPFKGSRAKIVKVDATKDEITVVLFEATVPIPVTVKVTDIKIIQREERD